MLETQQPCLRRPTQITRSPRTDRIRCVHRVRRNCVAARCCRRHRHVLIQHHRRPRPLPPRGIAAVFERLINNFDIMFDNHAYTHWYENNGVSREMMAHARNTIANLAQSYRDAS